MEPRQPRKKGISPGELLIVLAIIAITAVVVLLNFASTHSRSKEAALEENISLLREALDLYREDHGWYPCDPERDWNRVGDGETFKQQLTRYTNAHGEPSAERNRDFRFGPYLRSWPLEPISGSAEVTIDRTHRRIFDRMADHVSVGRGSGGWHYEPRSGNICANLGNEYPVEYAHY
ncbi:MAG: type II secretion system protein [Candidatus Eisenbacteria bacterium]|nr:type II secretion system protein [Candidatus Eisenbacteria bacterium]